MTEAERSAALVLADRASGPAQLRVLLDMAGLLPGTWHWARDPATGDWVGWKAGLLPHTDFQDVATITDSDASSALDAEVYRAPYPFWLAVITVTGTDVLAYDGSLLNGAFILTPSVPAYVPGWAVIEGSATLTVVNGVAVPIVIPCTDAVTPGFTYTITQRLLTPDGQGSAPITGVLVPHALGHAVDISALL